MNEKFQIHMESPEIIEEVDRRYGEPTIYDTVGEVPTDRSVFFFNQGHAQHELSPHLHTLVEQYGAVPYRLKSRNRRGYEIYISMEPSEIFRFVKEQISEGRFTDLLLDKSQALIQFLPGEWLQRRYQALLARRVHDKPLADVLFAFRQQVDQTAPMGSYIELLQDLVNAGNYEMAHRHFLTFSRIVQSLKVQHKAANHFFSAFLSYADKSEVQRRLHLTQRLAFELNEMRRAQGVTSEVLNNLPQWEASLQEYREIIEHLDH